MLGGFGGPLPENLKICPLNGAFGAVPEQHRCTLVTNGGHFAQIRGALWCKWGILPRFGGHLVKNLGHFAPAGGGHGPSGPPTGSAPDFYYPVVI